MVSLLSKPFSSFNLFNSYSKSTFPLYDPLCARFSWLLSCLFSSIKALVFTFGAKFELLREAFSAYRTFTCFNSSLFFFSSSLSLPRRSRFSWLSTLPFRLCLSSSSWELGLHSNWLVATKSLEYSSRFVLSAVLLRCSTCLLFEPWKLPILLTISWLTARTSSSAYRLSDFLAETISMTSLILRLAEEIRLPFLEGDWYSLFGVVYKNYDVCERYCDFSAVGR